MVTLHLLEKRSYLNAQQDTQASYSGVVMSISVVMGTTYKFTMVHGELTLEEAVPMPY